MKRPSAWSVGVVVPARNESQLIEPCVTSVLAALTAAGPAVDAWLVVAADSCTDDTAARARRAVGQRGEVHAVDARTVGGARRAGTELVLDHFTGARTTPERIWLMATDADTTVPEDWVRTHLRAADAGAAAVAGTVTVRSFSEHPAHVADLYRRHYTVRDDGRHDHLHGANFGVRADAYLAAGGWQPLASGEDHALWERLASTAHALASTIEGSVTTSGRRDGRAPGGFAGFLAHLGRSAPASATP